jgi:thiol-disulfide isomerase/thioredoxin
VSRSPLAAVADPGEDYLQSFSLLSQRIREGNSFSGNERNCAFLNRTDGEFVDMSFALGLDHADDSRGIAITDFDGDGAPDICMTNRTAPRLRLLRNALSTGNRWVSLRLKGDPAKRCSLDAIGARVTVVIGERSLHRTVFAGDGFLSQSCKSLFFGLGREGEIRSVSVRWPGGATEQFRGISPGGRFVLTQGSGAAMKPEKVIVPVSLASGKPQVPPDSGIRRIRLSQPLKMPSSLNFTDQEGNNVSLESLTSNAPLLINLWATWCAPCLVELSELGQQHEALQKAGIRVLALCVDGLGEGKLPASEKLRDLLDKYGFSGTAGYAGKPLVNVLNQLVLEAVYRHRDLPVPCSFMVDKGGWLTVIYKGRVRVATLLADRKTLGGGPDVARRESIPFNGIWGDRLLATHPVAVASAYREGGYNEDAREYLSDFLSKHPVVPGQRPGARQALQLADVHFNLGNIFSSQGDYNRAFPHFKAAVRFNPESARMRSRQVLATAQVGEVDLARKMAGEMNEQQPNSPDRLTLLGDVLVIAGEDTMAANAYNSALKINPRTIPAINSLAWIHATSDTEALRNGSRAVELAEFLMNAPGARENSEFLMTLAAAHAQAGNGKKASSVAQTAILHAKRNANQKAIARLEALAGKILKGQPVRD